MTCCFVMLRDARWVAASIGTVLAVLGCDADTNIDTDTGADSGAHAAAEPVDAAVAERDDAVDVTRPASNAPRSDGGFASFDSDGEACDLPVCGDGEATACGSVREACDSSDLSGLDCSALGFARGELACSPQCTLEPKQCLLCEADERIARCSRVETLAGTSYGLGLAWRDGVLVVATAISRGDAIAEGDAHPLRLIAMDAELEQLHAARQLGAEEAWLGGLVAVSDGFLVAYVDGWPGRGAMLHTQHLDASGEPDAEPLAHMGVSLGILVARPDGGPLLVTNATPEEVLELPDGGPPPAANPPRAARAVTAILLDETGEETWSVTTAPDAVVGELSAGTYTGDGFLFATEAIPSHAVAVQYVDLDGNVSLDTFAIPSIDDASVYYPQLAWDGSSAWLTWSDGGADEQNCSGVVPVLDGGGSRGGDCVSEPSELRWARLDGSGQLVEGPDAASGVVRSAGALLANATERVLVSGEAPTSTVGVPAGLRLLRLDTSMTPTAEPIPLVHGDSVPRFAAAFGPDTAVFVAWTRDPLGLLGVTRLER